MDRMSFVAVDVETANADMASICQIGLARFENGILKDEWKTYVDPEDFFDPTNVGIHRIDEHTIKGAQNFEALFGTLNSYLAGAVVVSHTHFDRVAIHQATQRYGITTPTYTWLDSARVARRTWSKFAWQGYGLHNVCSFLGYEFKHHDALEDAKASAHILLTAFKATGLDVDAWIKRVVQPIDPNSSSRAAVKRDGREDGPFFGEVLAFTGSLEIPRSEAADLASSIGCKVGEGVTKKTTMLVVGDQDAKRLAGHEKSSKHRKAEELIANGAPIRILRESDFKALVRLAGGHL